MNKQYIGKKTVTKIEEIINDLKIDHTLNHTLNHGLSFLIRAKNEELMVAQCLQSVADIADEIIFVDNNSTDKTFEIATLLANKYSNIFVYQYNIDVPRAGKHHEIAVEEKSLNTLATYYNWSLSKATKFNVIKWDCDFIPLKENLIKMINKYNLTKRDDYFSVWFTGKTLFYGEIMRQNDYYDEFRIFSKKNGFKWENYHGCETAAYYVWDCPKCYINGFSEELTDIRYKNLDTLKKQSSPIFFEIKTNNDIKDNTNILDKRDVNDNNILFQLKNNNTNFLTNIINIINTKHKILITLPSLTLGGGNVWAINIYKTLIDVGFNVKIYCNYLSKKINENVYIDSFDINDILTNMSETELFNYIINNDINYIIQTTNVFSSGHLSILKKYVHLSVLTHSDISHINNYIQTNKHLFDKIITVNNHTIKKFNSYDIKNTVFLPNYLDSIEYCGNKQTNKRFGIISRLSPDKNLIMVLYAFKDVLSSHPDYQFHIIGDDDDTTIKIIYYYIKKLDLEKSVIVHGYQKNVINFYHDLDFIILPSVSEGCSYNLLEAALAGTPIVCSDVGGNREIVENHAVLFELRGINDLSDNLLYVNNYNEHLKTIGYKLSTIDDQIVLNNIETLIGPIVDSSFSVFIDRMFNWNINVSNIVEALKRMINSYDYFLQEREKLCQKIKNRFSSKPTYFNSLMNVLELNYKMV